MKELLKPSNSFSDNDVLTYSMELEYVRNNLGHGWELMHPAYLVVKLSFLRLKNEQMNKKKKEKMR